MLLRTRRMLKKSGVNKGNGINYLAFVVRIFHVCNEQQSAVKPGDAIGGKDEPALIEVNWRNTQRSLSIPTDSPTPQNNFSYFELIPVYFCLFYLWKFHFKYFSHICHNFSMFRNVPGLFHVLGFIDGQTNITLVCIGSAFPFWLNAIRESYTKISELLPCRSHIGIKNRWHLRPVFTDRQQSQWMTREQDQWNWHGGREHITMEILKIFDVYQGEIKKGIIVLFVYFAPFPNLFIESSHFPQKLAF